MIQTQEIETKLLDFLKREVFPPEVNVTTETNLVATGLDSLALVRLLVFIENEYGFWVPENETSGDAFLNVRVLAATLARLRDAR